MKSYAYKPNRKLRKCQKDIAKNLECSEAKVVEKALTLYSLAKEKESEGYTVALIGKDSITPVIL